MSPRKKKPTVESVVESVTPLAAQTREEQDDGEDGMFVSEPNLLIFPKSEWDPSWRDPRVRISREDVATRKWELHGYYRLEEVGEDTIATEFGGGKWIAQVVAADDRGRQDIRRTRRFRLPGPYRPPIKILPGMAPAAAPASGPSSAPAVTMPDGTVVSGRMSPAEILSNIQVQQLIDISAASRKSSPPVVDYTPLILKGMEVLAAFLTRPKETDGVEILRLEMQQIRESMQRQPGPAVTGIADVVQAIESLMGLRDVISGDGGKKEDGESALYSLGGKLVELMGNQQKPTPSPIPTGQPGATVGTIPTPPSPAMPIWQQVLLRHAGSLMGAATRGVDPELAADYTAAMIPSEVEGAILEFLSRPDADKVLIQVIPPMGQFEGWAGQFIGALRKAFTPETGQEEA